MYTFQAKMALPVEQAIPKVLEQLKHEGFGVLMDLDLQATMKQKIGADIPAYHILGACNPQLAHQALMAEPEVGALLPCNVVVRSDGNNTIVSFMDPQAMTKLTTNQEVHAVANEAEVRLRRVCTALDTNTSENTHNLKP
jgi:uncharacterized protein (DUF302 family)